MKSGFTLIELLVVTSLITLMTALILPNYRNGDSQLAVQRAASQLSQDLRRAQEMALSSQIFGSVVPSGYGLYLDSNQPAQYILFADIDNDQRYTGLSEKVAEIAFEGKVVISNLSPEVLDTLTIVFVPPDPTTVFFPDAVTASIAIGTSALQKVVQVNKAGLIAVQ